MTSAVLLRLQECAIGPYEPFSKAVGCADGLANRFAMAFSLRNLDPAASERELADAFTAWIILCRVMAELEAAYPEAAGRGEAAARRLCDRLDRRDGKGDYA